MSDIIAPSHVDVQFIERELNELWKNNANPDDDKNAVTRACTLNLIACAPDRRTADAMTAAVQSLTASHPNRTVLIINTAADEARLDAWVQANCQMVARGAPQVCGEQITIDARGTNASQIASLVLSLLVPDLPVVMWYTGQTPFDDPVLQRLQASVNRLILDSASTSDPDDALTTMSIINRHHDEQRGYSISDLSWARLTPWRELTAQFFDTRAFLAHLRRLDSVEIAYVANTDGATNHVQGLLLVAWLTSCLGWSSLDDSVSVEGETIRLYLRRPAVTGGRQAIRLVTVELRPVPVSDTAPDGLAALRLRTTDNVITTFSVERANELNQVRTIAEVAGATPVTRLVKIEQAEIAQLLAGELRLLSRDRSFGAALKITGRWAAAIRG